MKQAILVRRDLKLTRGKMAAQAAHAAVEATLRSSKQTVEKWHSQGMKKIVLRVENQQELIDYQQRAKAAGLVASIITDAGKTHVAPGTMTCMAIGPASDDEIDKIVSKLKLFS